MEKVFGKAHDFRIDRVQDNPGQNGKVRIVTVRGPVTSRWSDTVENKLKDVGAVCHTKTHDVARCTLTRQRH